MTSDLFSSGICRVMICWIWVQRALQPYLSSRQVTSTGWVWSGTRVHRISVRCWTHNLGGHWGFAFLLSLRKTPADSGITFCGQQYKSITCSKYYRENYIEIRSFDVFFLMCRNAFFCRSLLLCLSKCNNTV